MTKYCLAYDEGNRIIREISTPKPKLEKYDLKAKKWIKDPELFRIYFGSIPAKVLSENDVKKMIGEGL